MVMTTLMMYWIEDGSKTELPKPVENVGVSNWPKEWKSLELSEGTEFPDITSLRLRLKVDFTPGALLRTCHSENIGDVVHHDVL
jgi:hypothetical protein